MSLRKGNCAKSGSVSKLLPAGERRELDRLLLERPAGLESVPKIHAHLNLEQRYGIARLVLDRYARRLRDSRQRERHPELAEFEFKSYLSGLPLELRHEVNRVLATRPRGLESVKKIYQHFGLKKHQVSFCGFERYARYRSWRDRLEASGRIVNMLFKSTAEEQAEVSNSVLLRLAGTVLKALEEDPERIKTEELQKLSKILAEQRGAAAKEKDLELKERKLQQASEKQEPTHPTSTELPDNFDELVKRIYGVELETPQKDPNPESKQVESGDSEQETEPRP